MMTFRNNYEINVKFSMGTKMITDETPGPGYGQVVEYTTRTIKSLVFEEDVINDNTTKMQIIIETVVDDVVTKLIKNENYIFAMIKVINYYKDENGQVVKIKNVINNAFLVEECIILDHIHETTNFKLKIEGVSIYSFYLRQESLLSTTPTDHEGKNAYPWFASTLKNRYPGMGVDFSQTAFADGWKHGRHFIPTFVKDIDCCSYQNDKYKAFFYPTFFFLCDTHIPYDCEWASPKGEGIFPSEYLMVNLGQNRANLLPTVDVTEGSEFMKEHMNQFDFRMIDSTDYIDYKKGKHVVGADSASTEVYPSWVNFIGIIKSKIFTEPNKFLRYDSNSTDPYNGGITQSIQIRKDVKHYRLPLGAGPTFEMRVYEAQFLSDHPKVVYYTFKDLDIQYINYKRAYNFVNEEQYQDRVIWKKLYFKKHASSSDDQAETKVNSEEQVFFIEQEVGFMHLDTGGGGISTSAAASASRESALSSESQGQDQAPETDEWGYPIEKPDNPNAGGMGGGVEFINETRRFGYRREEYAGMTEAQAIKTYHQKMDQISSDIGMKNPIQMQPTIDFVRRRGTYNEESTGGLGSTNAQFL